MRINTLFISALILLLSTCVGAREVHAQEFRMHKIGNLWDTFYDHSARTWNLVNGIPHAYIMLWPANRHVDRPWQRLRFDGPQVGGGAGYWIGARNWVDTEGNKHSKYVSELGFWYSDIENIGIPVYIRKYTRRTPPKVVVDGLQTSPPFPVNTGDELDPDIPSHEVIENVTRTNMGVDLKRRTYAYQNHHFRNLILIETVFTNTGNVDRDEEVELKGQNLQDVYFDTSIRPMISKEGARVQGYPAWWGSEYMEYYGEDYEDFVAGDQSADSLKVFYAWDADETERTPNADDYGNPDPETGQWLSPQYVGLAALYADESTTNKVNDPAQPVSARWIGFKATPSTSKQGNGIPAMYDFMTKGHRPSPKELGLQNTGLGGERQANLHLSYGPYQMDAGDSVRIVHAEVVNGVSFDKTAEFGAEYKAAKEAGNLDSFTWTDPTTGETYSGYEAKKAILQTGVDSVHQTAWKAKWLVEHDFNAPDPPMPPSLNVQSSGGKIVITWGDEPELEPDPDTGVQDFEGYRLYRAKGSYAEGNWQMIYEGTDNRYEDTDAVRGVAYYYYITAYDDGSQNTWGINPGEKLESSPFLAMTTKPAFRLKEPENSLSMVDVVPNPFNLSATQFPGEPNKILFANLTPYCTIRIYTMSGDLVKTLEHTSGSGEESWDQVTSSNQYLASGIYIYHIVARDENGDPTGEETTGKFIIVR